MSTLQPSEANFEKNHRLRARVMLLALSCGVLLMAGKFAAYNLTGSTAILSDAAESIVHLVATGFALYSVLFSAKPADETHPYGHGKMDFFSAGFEGALITTVALFIFYRSIHALMVPPTIEHLDIGVLIVSVVGLINGLLGYYLVYQGKKSRSIVLIADGQHLLSDTYTSIALVLGLGVVLLTGKPVLDAIIAMIFGVLVLVTGLKLMRQSFSGLLDEASPALLERITRALEGIRHPPMIDIHQLRSRLSGDYHHIDFHLILPRYWDLQTAHVKLHEIEASLLKALQEQGEVIIHPEPCTENLCQACRVGDCPVRLEPYRESTKWQREYLTRQEISEES